MSSPPLMATVAGVLACSTLVRATFGFGDALIAMPLLAMALGLKTATPLVALVASTLALIITARNWRHVHLGSAWRLTLASFAGIPVGMALLKGVHENTLQFALAVLLVGFALYNLLRLPLPRLAGTRSTYLFGLVAGVIGGAYNTNGPPVVIYATMRRWSPQRFRATLQGYFFVSGLAIVAGHGLSGLWTPTVLTLYVWVLPVVLVALVLGERLHHCLPPERFVRGVYLLLLTIGLTLLYHTLRGT